MKNFLLVILVFPALFLLSCGNSESESPVDSSAPKTAEEDWSFTRMQDTIRLLLTEAEKKDSVEHFSSTPQCFLFMKSGNLISHSVKNAVVIYTASDTTVWVDLYEIGPRSISKKNTFIEIPRPGVSFSVSFDDYSFDGYKDLFVVQTCSNGFAMQRGHVLIYEPAQSMGEFRLHHEFDSVCNPRPDPERKIVLGDSLIWCKGGEDVCKIQYEWRGANLWRKSRECPCAED